MDNICRCIVFLFLGQLVYRSIPKNVGNKPKTRRAFRRKLILTAVIEDNTEAVDDGVPVFLDNIDYSADCRVQLLVFLLSRIVIPVIFDRYRIGKNIVRQNCSVPVENPSSCALYFSCFLNLEFVVVQIALASYNLKIEHSLHQNREHHAEYNTRDKHSGLYKLDDCFLYAFQNIKQTCLHSFFLLLQVYG